MDYQEALDYIYSFINFDRAGISVNASGAYNLRRIDTVLTLIGKPHLNYPAMVIAGTKGKGSTSAMCAAALQAVGYKVGLYTQPHLHTYRERMQINRQLILPEAVANLTEYLHPVIETLKVEADKIGRITMYEISTALALKYFADQKIDIAVLEIGLGGRLDAVNVVEPLVSVITSISLDHMAILGNTLAKIAYEKAGIIKAGGKIISAAQAPEALAVIEQVSQSRNATLQVVGREIKLEEQAAAPAHLSPQFRRRLSHKLTLAIANITPFTLELPLLGRHQSQNAALAAAALFEQAKQPHGLPITTEAIQIGFKQVEWFARLELLQDEPGKPLIVADGAHNADSCARLRDALAENFYFENLILVVGSYKDKDIEGIFRELTRAPQPIHLILTKSHNPRATLPSDLAQRVAPIIGTISVILGDTVNEALQIALALAKPYDLICATGSLSIAAEARQFFGLATEGSD